MVVHAGVAGALVPAFDGLGLGANGLVQRPPNVSAISIWLSGGVPTSS